MKLVFGIGINDANYAVYPTIDGKQVMCPFYQTWMNMLIRCYSSKCHKKYPTYADCEVCEEWKTFSNFRRWMVAQDWEGKQLDKDLLGDKLYSPETCAFVPGWLNSLFTDRGRARGPYPIGVSKLKNRFRANLTVNGKQKHLGYFDTPGEAHSAYLEAKRGHVHELMANYPDQRVKQAVLEKVKC